VCVCVSDGKVYYTSNSGVTDQNKQLFKKSCLTHSR